MNENKTPKDIFFEALEKQGIYFPKTYVTKTERGTFVKNFIPPKGKVRYIEYDENGNIIDIF